MALRLNATVILSPRDAQSPLAVLALLLLRALGPALLVIER